MGVVAAVQRIQSRQSRCRFGLVLVLECVEGKSRTKDEDEDEDEGRGRINLRQGREQGPRDWREPRKWGAAGIYCAYGSVSFAK